MNSKYFMLLLLASLLTFSCQKQPKAKRLFVIGLDGASSKCVQNADMPFLKDFLKESSYSFKKRAILPSSSAINWATMFMSATSETHGYTEWGSKTPEIPSKEIGDNNIFPTVFQLYRKANPQSHMVCMYDWDGIKFLVDTVSFNYHAQTPSDEPENLAEMASNYIKENKPEVGVFIFNEPDHAGHQYGWDSTEYYSMLTRLDPCVEKVVNAIKDAGIYDESLIVIISDHGGNGKKGHGGKTLAELECISIFEGPNVKKGYCIDDSFPMHQYDVGATIADFFALELPDVCCGKPAKTIYDN